jgi:hypothetical protein
MLSISPLSNKKKKCSRQFGRVYLGPGSELAARYEVEFIISTNAVAPSTRHRPRQTMTRKKNIGKWGEGENKQSHARVFT